MGETPRSMLAVNVADEHQKLKLFGFGGWGEVHSSPNPKLFLTFVLQWSFRIGKDKPQLQI